MENRAMANCGIREPGHCPNTGRYSLVLNDGRALWCCAPHWDRVKVERRALGLKAIKVKPGLDVPVGQR